MTLTFHTRLKELSPEADRALQDYAALMSQSERTLFALHQKTGKSLSSFKKEVMARFGLTARQFNAIRYQLEGKVQVQKGIRKERIKTLKAQIRATERAIEETQKALEKAKEKGDRARVRSLRGKITGKKRRLDLLKTRLRKLQADEEAGRVSLCFGS